MNEIRPHRRGFFFPLLLIALGSFLFLSNLGYVQGSAWDIFAKFWPVLLILMGLDGFIKQEGWVWPTFLVGLGTVLLMGNLDMMPISAGAMLARFWPIILVAIGLDVAFGRRGSVGSTIARLVIGLLLIGGIVALSIFTVNQNVITEKYTQALQDATSASVRFEQAVGKQMIAGGTLDAKNLIEGQAGRLENENLDFSTKSLNGKADVKLVTSSIKVIGFRDGSNSEQVWDFKVNNTIPMDLTSKLAVGEQDIDLTGMKVNKLTVELAVGKSVVKLPEGIDITGSIENAIGEVTVYVPKDATVRIRRDTGITGVDIPSGWRNEDGEITSPAGSGPKIELHISLAIGSLRIRELP